MSESVGSRGSPLESILAFVQRLSDDRSGGVLGDALSDALAGLGFVAGFAFESLDGRVIAVTGAGLVPQGEVGPWMEVLRALAARAATRRKTIYVRDIRHARLDPEEYEALRELGWHTVIASPIMNRRAPLGVLVVAGHRQPAESGAARYLDAFARLAAFGIMQQRAAEHERSHRDETFETARLAELGLMTACVAHELRGPVAALNLHVEDQLKILEALKAGAVPAGTSQELLSILEDSKAAVMRLVETLGQMSTLTRRDTQRADVDLGELARDTLPIVRANLERRGVRLTTDLGPGCVTRGRRDGLAQVLVNLVLNAADACEESSNGCREVTVSTQSSAEHVSLTVSDSGPGVPSHRVHAIFEPFFTTKKPGRGTGLGLKICSDVVSQHNGHIEVENHPWGGAVFRVVLPRVEDVRSGLRAKSIAPTIRVTDACRRVLVVDDDVVLARTLKRSLRPHEVTTVHSCEAALRALATLDPDVVLCDMFLPDGSGADLHARATALRADVRERFLFLTGGGLSSDEAAYLRSSGCSTLIKPITAEELRVHLERIGPSVQPPSALPTLSWVLHRPR